jgi:predicted phage terminase large subunit-like protein
MIERIMSLSQYKNLFDVHLREDSQAKDAFTTEWGGTVASFGSAGAITGRNAGLPGLNRFSGAVVIDDSHKPDEVHSDLIRESVITNFRETIQQRPRGVNVPIVFIGQRLHEQDLPAYFIAGEDGYDWDKVILKSIDEAGNALYPEAFPLDMLKIRQEKDRYVFAAQHQQDPQPAGGGLFTEEDFPLLAQEPQLRATFITADTAETAEARNDATVFSFWGIYNVEIEGRDTKTEAIHWIACREIRVEPKDLEREFLDFWQECARHEKPPMVAFIEKKSTGVTLISVLKEMRGLKIREIERTRKSGSKSQRFIDIQPHIAAKQVSLPLHGAHTEMCIKHMCKITNNDSHAHDDVCFVGQTIIATTRGNKQIKDVKVGDKVLTPMGIGVVSAAGATNYSAQVITAMGLTGTPNHPIFSNSTFKRLDTLSDADSISSLTLKGLIEWAYRKLLCSMESNIGSWGRDGIILASRVVIKDGSVLKDFMSRFMNFIAALKFKKAMWFIIKMVTALITTIAIWSVFRTSNTWKNIVKLNQFTQIVKRIKKIFIKPNSQRKNGTQAKKELRGIAKTQRQAFINLKTIFAKNAARITPAQRVSELNSVESPVTEGIDEETFQKSHLNACSVRQNLNAKNLPVNTRSVDFAQDLAPAEKQKSVVYNLTIEGHGVYYANGILVSNCDTATDAVRIALMDKLLMAYTHKNALFNTTCAKALNHMKRINEMKTKAYKTRT